MTASSARLVEYNSQCYGQCPLTAAYYLDIPNEACDISKCCSWSASWSSIIEEPIDYHAVDEYSVQYKIAIDDFFEGDVNPACLPLRNYPYDPNVRTWSTDTRYYLYFYK